MAKSKEATTRAGAARVYSYIRFSTPEQAMGDSERRQVEAAREWATKHGYRLDESLKPDKGVSGFNGDHRRKGHLGTFLKMVQAGSVPRGSILVVENIDRLGREGVFTTLREIFFTLFDYGVTIQTLVPEQAFDQKTIETGEAFLLIAQIIRARDESERKSHRGCQNWKQKKKRAQQDGCILTAKCPAWLRVVTDDLTKQRRFEILPGAKETIRTMFELKLSGLGVRRILKQLNSNAKWTRPNGFHASYLNKIMQNRAVIGEHQPCKNVGGKFVPDGDPLVDYFPSVIKPQLFFAVQAMYSKNKGKGGKTGKVGNLFTHIVKCAYCGGPMSFSDKSRSKKTYEYLVCDRGRRAVGCARHAIRYDECEQLVLENCHKLRPELVLPNPDDQAVNCGLLQQEIDGQSAELKDLEQQVENLTDQITRTKSPTLRDRYELKMESLLEQQSTLTVELVATTNKLADAEKGKTSLLRWKQDLNLLMKSLKKDDPDLRMRLRSHLRDLIAKIEVFSVGYTKEYRWENELQGKKTESSSKRRSSLRDGDDIAEYLYSEVDQVSSDFVRFVRHIVKRRMSKEGRFLRVHFRTGMILDLVPPGSLASGMELLKDGPDKGQWTLVSPRLNEAWKDFKTKQRSVKSR